jgi:hypothetical protein
MLRFQDLQLQRDCSVGLADAEFYEAFTGLSYRSKYRRLQSIEVRHTSKISLIRPVQPQSLQLLF